MSNRSRIVAHQDGNTHHPDENVQDAMARWEEASMPVGMHEGRGKWTREEHARFLEGMRLYPRGPWRLVAQQVESRTVRQTMTHAQKFRQKVARWMRGLRTKQAIARMRTGHQVTEEAMALEQLRTKPRKARQPSWPVIDAEQQALHAWVLALQLEDEDEHQIESDNNEAVLTRSTTANFEMAVTNSPHIPVSVPSMAMSNVEQATLPATLHLNPTMLGHSQMMRNQPVYTAQHSQWSESELTGAMAIEMLNSECDLPVSSNWWIC